jgi:hypothetical protein
MSINNALGLLEEISQVSEELRSLSETISASESDKALLERLGSRLDGVLKILDSDAAPIEMFNTPSLAGNKYVSIIEKLGLTGEIIHCRKLNMPIATIAQQFKLSKETVSRFLKYYDKQNAVQKSKYEGRSIFDTTDRLEELQTLILRNIYRLEGCNDNVAVKYVGELRQCLVLAVSITEKMANAKALTELRELVASVLLAELPHKRRDILDKIKTVTSLTTSLMPGSTIQNTYPE